MKFSAISNLNAYTKKLDMKNKVEHRKKTGDYKSDGISTMSSYIQKKREDDKKLMETLTQNEDGTKKDEKLSSLRTKYMNGGRLTYEEKKYISLKDPQLYASIKESENEAKAYEREIKNAKTKDDVQRIHVNHVAKSLSRITSTQNNPNIPKEKKLAICAGENQKMALKCKIKAKLVASGEYEKLPTEQEERQVEKDIREAKEGEAKIKNDTEVETEIKTSAEDKIITDKAGTHTDSATDKTNHLEKESKSVSESEHTDEAEKVRKAKYKKAAKKYAVGTDIFSAPSQISDKTVSSPSSFDVQV